MLVMIFSPVVFPHITFRLTSLISMYSMCSSSSGRSSCSSSNNVFLWTVSNAFLISSISRCVSQSFYVIAFSASSLKVNTFSVVLLPALYAACVIGILLASFWLVLLIIHMAKIFFITESRLMGLRFAGGPCGFLVWGGAPASIPSFSSSGYSPDLAMLLNIYAILLWMTSGLYFSSSAVSS